MAASLKREELHAFSDGAALLGVAVCAVIGFAWAVAGRDPGMVLAALYWWSLRPCRFAL